MIDLDLIQVHIALLDQYLDEEERKETLETVFRETYRFTADG